MKAIVIWQMHTRKQVFNMVKCIREKCPMYYSCEIYDSCRMQPVEYVRDECIGIAKISPNIERLACEMAKINNELNRLTELEDYIRDNQ